jgi:WD40 repeat protein
MNTLHTALRCLRHPAALVGVALLLLNDHVLKTAAPSPLTGKLSDFAGLFFFPFLLAALLGVGLDRLRIPARTTGQLAIALTGVWFALVKTAPWANALTAAALSRALGFPARIVLDPTDTLALIVLWPAWRLWAGMAKPEQHRRRPDRMAWLSLGVASLAAIATTPPSTPPPTPPFSAYPSMLRSTLQSGEITDLKLSPDGTRLAVGATLGVFVYAADSLEQIWSGPSGGWALEMRVAWSADGARIASGSQTTPVMMWDAASGSLLHTLPGDRNLGLAFSPDGTRLAVSTADSVTILDTTSWSLVSTPSSGNSNALSGLGYPVDRVTFSPDGTRLAAAGYKLAVWDAATWNLVFPVEDLRSKVNALAFSPDSSRITAATENDRLVVWEAGTGKRLSELSIESIVQSQRSGYYQGYDAVALSPDGASMALNLSGSFVLVADAATGGVRASMYLADTTADPAGMALGPDGDSLFIGLDASNQQAVRVYDVATGSVAREVVIPLSLGDALAVSWAGSRALLATGASGSGVGGVILWDAAGSYPIRALPTSARWVSAVAFSPDGATLAAQTDLGTMMWDVDTGAMLQTIADAGGGRLVAWSPDGEMILRDSTTPDFLPQLTLTDAHTGETVRDLAGSSRFSAAEAGAIYSPDGSTIAYATTQGVVVWDAVTGQQGKILLTAETITSLAWAPDGNTLAVGLKGGSVIVWNHISETEISWPLPADYSDSVRGLAFSPDGKALATAARGIIVWDSGTGTPLGFLDSSSLDAFTFVSWSPDGKTVVGGREREVRVWSLGP